MSNTNFSRTLLWRTALASFNRLRSGFVGRSRGPSREHGQHEQHDAEWNQKRPVPQNSVPCTPPSSLTEQMRREDRPDGGIRRDRDKAVWRGIGDRLAFQRRTIAVARKRFRFSV